MWTKRIARIKRITSADLIRCHRVRELVFAYRPVRDCEGRPISVPSLALSSPQITAHVVAPLLADQPVETFAVACVSARNRLAETPS